MHVNHCLDQRGEMWQSCMNKRLDNSHGKRTSVNPLRANNDVFKFCMGLLFFNQWIHLHYNCSVEWESSLQCIYTISKGCNVTKLDRFVNFVLLHISTVSRPSNSEWTGEKTCRLWVQVETQPLTFLSVPVHAEEWVEVCRSFREPLFTRWAGKPQGGGGEASECITLFRRGQELKKKKPWKCCRQQLSAWPLRFLTHTHTHTLQFTHTFILSLFYWIHVTVFALYCSC